MGAKCTYASAGENVLPVGVDNVFLGVVVLRLLREGDSVQCEEAGREWWDRRGVER